MNRSSLALTILATLSVLSVAGPAYATKGRDAVNLCIDRGPACTWTVDKAGGIDIQVDGHNISCPGATKPCEIIGRTGKGNEGGNGVDELLSKAH